ncbi:hypothetical protein K469DRAFT_566174, partial [Zopfia rhizophila CBS 207.26]
YVRKHEKYVHESKVETYSCQLCPKTFPWPNSLRLHEEIVHKGKRYSCPSCPKTFSQTSGLWRHHREEHQGK